MVFINNFDLKRDKQNVINYEFTISNKTSLIYFLNPDFFCPQINTFFAEEEYLDKRIKPGIPNIHP